MDRTELLNLLEATFRTLDEQQAAVRAAFTRALDRVHERIVELVRVEPDPETSDNGQQRRQTVNRS